MIHAGILIGSIPNGDLAALALFCVVWLGYGPAVRMLGRGSINVGLYSVRTLWMRSMLVRENRIFDSALIGHVMHSASFFASTSLIAIGALIGVLTGLDRLEPAVTGLSIGVPVSRQLLEIKVLLPLAVLVHGMFKLTWALRQLNYTVALMGAMPPAPIPEARRLVLADAVGGVMSSGISTFTDGIRSYYFSIAGLAWLGGPWLLAAASVGLMGVLMHRQFRSGVSRKFRLAQALVEEEHGTKPG